MRSDERQAKRILIVDDHPVLRKGLGRLIDSKHGLTVCGEASNATECIELIRTRKPDLVIVDVSLPDVDGIELTKNVRKEFPHLPVLVLSMHEEPLYAVRALRAGAMGYIIKGEAIEKIVEAVGKVLNGQRYISPTISDQLITKPNEELQPSSPSQVAELTDRELKVLELLGKGNEVREIAKQLRLSPKTVETHRTHIREKLNLKNARQVARFALQWVTEQNA